MIDTNSISVAIFRLSSMLDIRSKRRRTVIYETDLECVR